jgi:hypothetical protein
VRSTKGDIVLSMSLFLPAVCSALMVMSLQKFTSYRRPKRLNLNNIQSEKGSENRRVICYLRPGVVGVPGRMLWACAD